MLEISSLCCSCCSKLDFGLGYRTVGSLVATFLNLQFWASLHLEALQLEPFLDTPETEKCSNGEMKSGCSSKLPLRCCWLILDGLFWLKAVIFKNIFFFIAGLSWAVLIISHGAPV